MIYIDIYTQSCDPSLPKQAWTPTDGKNWNVYIRSSTQVLCNSSLTGSSSAFLTSSPYRFLKHGPQNWPRIPRQSSLRQHVFVSTVFWRHWWHVEPWNYNKKPQQQIVDGHTIIVLFLIFFHAEVEDHLFASVTERLPPGHDLKASLFFHKKCQNWLQNQPDVGTHLSIHGIIHIYLKRRKRRIAGESPAENSL